jgi:hypothetical protein
MLPADPIRQIVQEMTEALGTGALFNPEMFGSMLREGDNPIRRWRDSLLAVQASSEAEIASLRHEIEKLEKEHYAEQVLLAAMAGESVLQARGYSVVNLAHLIAERASVAERRAEAAEARLRAIKELLDKWRAQIAEDEAWAPGQLMILSVDEVGQLSTCADQLAALVGIDAPSA